LGADIRGHGGIRLNCGRCRRDLDSPHDKVSLAQCWAGAISDGTGELVAGEMHVWR